MEYQKMYFPKVEMSQTVPTGNYSPDAYAAYAESFDLSLLPTDGEVPLSPQSELTSHSSPLVSLDYIPATIYHDHPLKIEKPSSPEDDNLLSPPPAAPLIADNTNSVLLQQLQKQYQFYPSPLPSPPQDNFHYTFPPSPCPSVVDQSLNQFTIKQEYHTLPPSPPESSGAPSPFSEIKTEPDTDTETLIDINSLLEKSFKDLEPKKPIVHPPQDHQLLREYLQDTSFQKKHNLKPLALESLIGGLGVRGDIEPVISLALEHAKRDAQAMCAKLKISPDPQQWTTSQVHAWLRSTIDQFKLPHIDDLEVRFSEDGASLACLTEDEFHRRAPQAGSTLHAQLEIWKLACTENFPSVLGSGGSLPPNLISACGSGSMMGGGGLGMQLPSSGTGPAGSSGPSTSNLNLANWPSECSKNLGISDDEDEEMAPASVSSAPTPAIGPPTKTGRTGGSHIHLWQFLKELLASPQTHGTAIRWLDRNKGVFKIEDSVRVAKLWGRRKNRPAMNYDKLSRSIRQYYKKGIMKKTERSQRLVYQFCHPYCL